MDLSGLIPKLSPASFMGDTSVPLGARLLGLSMAFKGHPEMALQIPMMMQERRMLADAFGGGEGSVQPPSAGIAKSTDVQPGSVNGAPLPKDVPMSDLGSLNIPRFGVKATPAPVSAADMAPYPQAGAQAPAPAAAAPNGIPLNARQMMALSFVNPQAAQALARYMSATRPDMMVLPDGTVANSHDAALAGRTFPKAGEGQVVLRDSAGNITGMMNVPGYTDAVAAKEGATTGAQEAAKAPYTIVDVPMSDGSVRKMPLSMAGPLLASRAFPGGGNGGPASPGDGAEIGRSPSAAETKLAEDRAATQAEREKALPASQAMLQDTDNLIDQFSSSVHRILGDRQDPKTGQWQQGVAPSEINAWSAGRIPGHFPALTGQATNLEADLDGLRALISSEKLAEMRRAAGEGSLNMRTTQGEIFNIFGNLAGPLHQTQDPAALTRSLREAVDRLEQTRSVMHDQYGKEFGNVQQPTPGATQPIPPRAQAASAPPSRAAIEAEMRRRGLLH